MTAFICTTCGTQFPPTQAPPPHCPICEDERQYVNAAGQAWTTLDRLRGSHANTWRQLTPELLAIHTQPGFAIGQRALLLRTPDGNLLWDCITLLDEATITLITALGGLRGIAISHPHYYTTMVEWGRAFDCPVHLHAADREWVMRPDPLLRFWDGETRELLPGVTLIRAGGHYPGGTVLHCAAGEGTLLSGDILQVVPDRRHVGFMWSYPNLIPLSAAEVGRVAGAVAGRRFARIYGAFPGREITTDARAAVARSAERAISRLSQG